MTVPGDTTAGPQQLMVTADNGQSTVNGLTFHVIKTGPSYNPQVYEVGPGKPYAPVETLPAPPTTPSKMRWTLRLRM